MASCELLEHIKINGMMENDGENEDEDDSNYIDEFQPVWEKLQTLNLGGDDEEEDGHISNHTSLQLKEQHHHHTAADVFRQPLNLEDYEFRNTIGTGTFGRVYLVQHMQTRSFQALKVLPISEIIRLKQVDHVQNEKEILFSVEHPFVIKLLLTNHDPTFLYLLFEYVPGGELFSYLRNAGHFSNSTTQFYASQLVLVLEYLHLQNVVYRDLKPENLLLDSQGHLKVTDFGFAKKLVDRTWTLCGTPEYLAPEIILNKGHNKAVDWWAFGIILFEMLVGYPPFYDETPFGIYEKILDGKVEWPKMFNTVVKDLIRKLLVPDRSKRFGSMKNGADDVKNHRWFRGISWMDVYDKKFIAPILPKIRYEGDVGNFDSYTEIDMDAMFQPVQLQEQALFSNF